MKGPELLAPAGDLEKLKTAVDFGADAVYLAGERWGLRTASKNFSREELQEGIAYAHARGVHVHVTLNAMPHEEEFEGLSEYVKELEKLGVDALIVSDPGVFQVVRESVPDMEIHISTQASVTNSQTVNFWYALGASRIVLARELSLEEIADIRRKSNPNIELEVFVHGAMCISYSGRCLLSNYMTGRDANRGDCAHACRWNYKLIESKRPDEAYEIGEDGKGTYILNSKDLCLLPHLEELMKVGVASFKIEGRVKSAFYVATVVRAYRLAVDAILSGNFTDEVNAELSEELTKCSHRAFTTGFLFDKPDANSQNYESAGYERHYDFVGVVDELDVAGGQMHITQRNKFSVGDTLEALMPTPGIITFEVTEMKNEEGERIESAPHAEQKVTLPYIKGVEKGALLRREIR